MSNRQIAAVRFESTKHAKRGGSDLCTPDRTHDILFDSESGSAHGGGSDYPACCVDRRLASNLKIHASEARLADESANRRATVCWRCRQMPRRYITNRPAMQAGGSFRLPASACLDCPVGCLALMPASAAPQEHRALRTPDPGRSACRITGLRGRSAYNKTDGVRADTGTDRDGSPLELPGAWLLASHDVVRLQPPRAVEQQKRREKVKGGRPPAALLRCRPACHFEHKRIPNRKCATPDPFFARALHRH